MPLSSEASGGHTARRPANRPGPPRPRRPERGGEHDHANSKRIACTAGTGGRTAPALATRQRVQRPWRVPPAAPRSAEQVKRRATPPRHGPTLSTTARAASSPPPCRLYSTTAAGENQRPGGAVQKNFPRRGNPQSPKKIAKKCLTKRRATVYAESTERHATVNRPTSRKGKTP